MVRAFAVLIMVEAMAAAACAAATGAKVSSDVSIPQVVRIDSDIQSGWKESEIVPSAPATDEEFCRRVFLDLLGRIPTVDELRSYTSDRRSDRKWRLVQRLLYTDEYTIDFADHWSTIWANLLVGRANDQRRNSPVDRPGLEKYLRDSFAQNTPYDQFARELIAAVGTNRPGNDKFNGAVNFLAGKLDDNATQATAQTAKIFLGMQVQCTQCHNHPFNEWKQNQFWQLNAFFRQATALRRFKQGSRDVDYFELANQDFGGEDRPMDAENARIYYELRNGRLEAAFPVFVDGTAIGRSGYIAETDRRSELSKLIVQSPNFSRAIVNRLWAHFLGYGFTRPVDDMGPHNPPVHPELLDYLAEQTRENS
ncbi:MAG: DUF1549 domain-containing protein, partial [Planctomycetales bacterium]|nr:DUF1549 domain-containing protein [Planctomycetales bacterium]